jgi:hypothetical protein
MPTHISVPPARSRGRRAFVSGHHSRRLRSALLCCAGAAIVSAGTVVVPATAQAAGSVYLGSTQMGEQQLERQTGQQMSSHAYGTFQNGVPQGRMITVKAPGTSWRTTAGAQPGSALYNNIVRWADTIRSRPGPILVAFHHEPEAAGSTSYGTQADYIAAYRRVVSIFRSRNVTNVTWTWQMTEWSFRVNAADRRSAPKWYPGDSYVDVVGSDAYNWSTCKGSSGRWEEFKVFGDPVVQFARAHGKLAAFPEFGSQADPRRAQWLANARDYLVANRATIAGAYYFNQMDPNANQHQTCKWPLSTSQEIDIYRQMARNTAVFRTD